MKIFCTVPVVCLHPAHEAATQVRNALNRAIEQGLQPLAMPRLTKAIAVTLTAEQISVVTALAEKHGITTPGRVVGGLLYALHSSEMGETHEDDTGEDAALRPITKGLRSGQVKVTQEIATMLSAGKVVFSECGTGTGKGRLIAHAAAFAVRLRDAGRLDALPDVDASALPSTFTNAHCDRVRAQYIERSTQASLQGPQPRPCVLVAAPSIENVIHLLREWDASRQHIDPKQHYKTAVLLGRAQFVAASTLDALLSEAQPDEYIRIRQWRSMGMPAGETEASQHLASCLPGIFGLMADLERLSTQEPFDFRACALTDEDDAVDQEPYKQHKLAARHADVVFTTQALLALDNLGLASNRMTTLLPPVCCVLIDEAHLLENTQANVAAKSLSIHRLRIELHSPAWKVLRKQSAATEALSQLSLAAQHLQTFADETWLPVGPEHGPDKVSAWQEAATACTALGVTLKKMLKSLDNKMDRLREKERSSIHYTRNALQALESISKGWTGVLHQSPKRGMISLTMGPPTVGRHLAARWTITPAVALFSGTMSHISSNGSSCKGMADDLQVPAKRFSQSTPLHPQWLFNSTTLMQPSKTCFHRLVPPSAGVEDDAALIAWAESCAQAISLAAHDAAGGMLVLMTGFDRLDILAKRLAERPDLAERLIVHSRGASLASLKQRYTVEAMAGKKPIWLATGAAWVGLDLSDNSVGDDHAEDDLLLTDLVIPALPFGLDRTTTHAFRVMRQGFYAEITTAQRRMRQGIGRLIRREGLVDRRLWILDGRLVHPGTANYTADMRRALLPYLHKKEFHIAT